MTGEPPVAGRAAPSPCPFLYTQPSVSSATGSAARRGVGRDPTVPCGKPLTGENAQPQALQTFSRDPAHDAPHGRTSGLLGQVRIGRCIRFARIEAADDRGNCADHTGAATARAENAALRSRERGGLQVAAIAIARVRAARQSPIVIAAGATAMDADGRKTRPHNSPLSMPVLPPTRP